MKRQITKLIAMILLLSLTLLVFVGCEGNDDKGTLTLMIEGGKTYTVELSEVEGSEGLLSVLEYLKNKQGLSYEASNGFLTAVDSLVQDYGTNTYIYIYTTVTEDFDVSAYAQTKTVGNITFTSSGVGARDMHVKDGAIIYIGTVVWA